jgi:hypothetical protein
MLAHRVGALGAILAVLVLSLELVGALAWKHHVSADPGITSALVLHGEPSGVEQLSTSSVPTSSSVVLDSTLEQVTVSARAPF